MSPDFDELFADDAAAPEELAELRTVHELLLSASPPPSLPARLARAPRVGRPERRWLPRRRGRAALAFVAAAGTAAAFALGYNLGGTAASGGRCAGRGRAASAAAAAERRRGAARGPCAARRAPREPRRRR